MAEFFQNFKKAEGPRERRRKDISVVTPKRRSNFTIPAENLRKTRTTEVEHPLKDSQFPSSR